MIIRPETVAYVKQQNENRLLWQGFDTEESIRKMIFAEKIEYDVQKQECYITDDLTALALEAGDVLYLTTRYKIKFGNIPSDILAIHFEVCSDMEELGVEINDAVMGKIQRNAKKYDDHLMSNGRSYEEAVRVVKDSWKAMGGDVAWSHIWLDYLAHETPLEKEVEA